LGSQYLDQTLPHSQKVGGNGPNFSLSTTPLWLFTVATLMCNCAPTSAMLLAPAVTIRQAWMAE